VSRAAAAAAAGIRLWAATVAVRHVSADPADQTHEQHRRLHTCGCAIRKSRLRAMYATRTTTRMFQGARTGMGFRYTPPYFEWQHSQHPMHPWRINRTRNTPEQACLTPHEIQ